MPFDEIHTGDGDGGDDDRHRDLKAKGEQLIGVMVMNAEINGCCPSCLLRQTATLILGRWLAACADDHIRDSVKAGLSRDDAVAAAYKELGEQCESITTEVFAEFESIMAYMRNEAAREHHE